MREKRPVDSLILALRALPGAEIIKHNDASTGGIPDISATFGGYTSWLEVKLLRNGQTLRSELEVRQLATCRRLERGSGTRCWIIAFRAPGRAQHTLLYRPTRIRFKDDSAVMILPEPREVYASLGPGNLLELANAGVLALRGFAYAEIATLIRLTHVSAR
jgi:hypothetical protein